MVDTAARIWSHPENGGRRGRRLAAWVAWQAWQRTLRRPWTVPFHGGIRMVCHPHDHITTLVIYCGLYDAAEMRFLLAWLRPGDTFVDVGANVAPYSLLATTVEGVSAVAFEPGTLARRRAQANIELNGLGGRLTLVPAAVSDADSRALLTTDRWATNALVDDGHPGPVEVVDTVRLDTYAADHDLGRVTLVKVDVEGHEPAALRGAAALVDDRRPALLVEVNDPVEDLRALVGGWGYVPVDYDPATRRLARRDWPRAAGGNLILVPDLDGAVRRVTGT